MLPWNVTYVSFYLYSRLIKFSTLKPKGDPKVRNLKQELNVLSERSRPRNQMTGTDHRGQEWASWTCHRNCGVRYSHVSTSLLFVNSGYSRAIFMFFGENQHSVVKTCVHYLVGLLCCGNWLWVAHRTAILFCQKFANQIGIWIRLRWREAEGHYWSRVYREVLCQE
jgi:hypothetical protein